MGSVNVRHEGELLFACQVGNHTLHSDVPSGAGGQDRGPTGTELLASALGCCMAAAVAWYGARDGVDTSGLRVEVSYQ